MMSQAMTPILMMQGIYLNRQNVAEVALEEEAEVKLLRLRNEGKFSSVCTFILFYFFYYLFIFRISFHLFTMNFSKKVATACYIWLILVAVLE